MPHADAERRPTARKRRWPIVAPAHGEAVEPGPVPTFSVIIAAYQAAAFVADAVRSALGQTSPPHEVIVCDDGSTDDIEGALTPFAEGITLLRREHSGEGATKNAAARAASGEFLAILDADDIYLPEMLQALGSAAAVRPDLDLLATDAYIEVDGSVVSRFYEGSRRFEVVNQRRAVLEENFLFLTAIRRRCFLECGGFDETPDTHNDWVGYMRLVMSGCRAGLINVPLIRYRAHEGAMSSDQLGVAVRRVRTLDLARQSIDMEPDERAVLDRSLAKYRLEADLVETRVALGEGRAAFRRRALAIAAHRGYGIRTRLKALGAGIAPRLAGRLLAARERRRWVGVGGEVARSPD